VAGLLLLGTLAGSGARWDPTLMTAGVFRLATLDRSLRYGDCPDPDSPLQRHFREGPGRAQVRRAEAVVGYRPELKDPCDPVAGRRLIYYQEGVVATVSTWHAVVDGFEDQSCWEYLSLQVNGKNDASASSAFRREAGLRCADYVGQPWRIEPGRVSMRGDMETQVLSGLLGPLVLPGPRPPRRALVIGWGSGISVGEMARLGDLRVEAVELEPEVLRAAQAFERYNRHASRASNVEIHEADGRNVLLAMREGFDVIVSEPSNPWMTGAASLFTREFFQLIRRRLRPDGVFIQWLQLYEISTENVLSIIATLRSVFPRVTIFRSQHAQVDLLLVASFRPLAMEGARLACRMRAPRMRGALARIQITSLGDLVARYLVSPAEVDRLVRGVPVNTDDNARIEFSAPRDLINYRKHSPARILARLQRGVAPVRQRVVHAPGSLGIELVDAFVKIGDPRRAREVLRALPDTPAKRKRRRMLRWLTNRADVNRLLQAALGRHPGGESLRRILGAEGAISATQRAQAVRALADAPASEQTFRMLGLLLFPTRHQRLSLLFLTASQQLRAAPLPKIERLRVYLLHRFELHDVALQRALDANPPRM
jgi:SAM-dependent methyltransferase